MFPTWVLVNNPKLKQLHFSNDIELGMRESVHCNVVYGEPPFEFLWFKDGQPVKGHSRYFCSKNGRIHFQYGHIESGCRQ
ncbi:hypothetical protein CEXT_729001 [Caerostris extrusa]|uniref:Ig-like domain-containing protein n=1 Tax=Caerostris extrusa TaxID=172846 RepID=A0AAV4S1B9_CAEEX|nr:hypothetical protein CEXT_729001 [Caerostris extrusa]